MIYHLTDVVTAVLAEPDEAFGAADLQRLWISAVGIEDAGVRDVLEDVLVALGRRPGAPMALRGGRQMLRRDAPVLAAALQWGLTGAVLTAAGYAILPTAALTEILPRLVVGEQAWFHRTERGLHAHLPLVPGLDAPNAGKRLHAALSSDTRSFLSPLDLDEFLTACLREKPPLEAVAGCRLTFREPIGHARCIGLSAGQDCSQAQHESLEMLAARVRGLAASEALALYQTKTLPAPGRRFPWLMLNLAGDVPPRPFVTDLTPGAAPLIARFEALRDVEATEPALRALAADVVRLLDATARRQIHPWLSPATADIEAIHSRLRTVAGELVSSRQTDRRGPLWRRARAGAQRLWANELAEPFRLHETSAPSICWLVSAEPDLGALVEAYRRGLV